MAHGGKGGKVGKINSAAKHTSAPRVDMTKRQGKAKDPAGHESMSGAVAELHRQHPEHHSDRGPHHGGHAHHRHEPLHGMHPKKHHGR